MKPLHTLLLGEGRSRSAEAAGARLGRGWGGWGGADLNTS